MTSKLPEIRDEVVAWPPPEYVPYDVVYPRWSATFDDADLSSTTVSLIGGGVNTTSLAPEHVGRSLGDDYIAWRFPGMSDYQSFPKPVSDLTYQVTLHDVVIGGAARDIVYDVTLFDPFHLIIPGDFDGNGMVDGADLRRWKGDFGIDNDSDSDDDGDSDGRDFLAWQSSFEPASGTAAVPEPGTLALVCCLALWRLCPRHASSAFR